MEAKRVLVPVTGLPVDHEALDLACLLTRQNKGELIVVYVIAVTREHALNEEIPEESARAERALQDAENHLARVGSNHIRTRVLQARNTGPAIIHMAEDVGADLIVVGMPYRRRYGAFSLGETVPYLLQHATCPVIVVREALPRTSPTREPAHSRG